MPWSFKVSGTPKQVDDTFNAEIERLTTNGIGEPSAQALYAIRDYVGEIIDELPPHDVRVTFETSGHVEARTGPTSRNGSITCSIAWQP